MEATDRRVKRTEKLLMDSLISLSLQKGYDNVTIKDITDHADIAYSTFFRHYSDKPALLAALVGEAVNTLRDLLGNHSDEEKGKLLFQHVEAHEALYRVIFSSPGTSHVLQEVLDEIKNELIKEYRSHPYILLPPDIVANHIVTASVAMIRWWLNNDKAFSTERMGHIYNELIMKASMRSAFGSDSL